VRQRVGLPTPGRSPPLKNVTDIVENSTCTEMEENLRPHHM